MRTFLLSVATVMFLVLQPVEVHAQTLLAERTFSGGGSFNDGDEIFLSFLAFEVIPSTCEDFGNPISFAVFDRLRVTEADVGRIFNISVDSSSNAAGAAALLTNGIADFLSDSVDTMSISVGANFPESFAIVDPFSVNGIDLAGQQIGGFGMRLNDLTVGGGEFSLTATWSIYSEPVPEPSSTLFALVGMLSIGTCRRAKRL